MINDNGIAYGVFGVWVWGWHCLVWPDLGYVRQLIGTFAGTISEVVQWLLPKRKSLKPLPKRLAFPRTSQVSWLKLWSKLSRRPWCTEMMSWSVDSASSEQEKRKLGRDGILQLVKIWLWNQGGWWRSSVQKGFGIRLINHNNARECDFIDVSPTHAICDIDPPPMFSPQRDFFPKPTPSRIWVIQRRPTVSG